MSERLHIIMPCARPWNIPVIAPAFLGLRSFAGEPVSHPFELRWHILLQGPEPDPKGVNKVNEALAMIRDGWFATWSDDTVHDPRIFQRLGEAIAQNPNAVAVVFSECRPGGGVLHAAPGEMLPCHVDGSQVIMRRDFLGDARMDYAQYKDQADGYLLKQLHDRAPKQFVFVDEVLVYYNRLEGAP